LPAFVNVADFILFFHFFYLIYYLDCALFVTYFGFGEEVVEPGCPIGEELGSPFD